MNIFHSPGICVIFNKLEIQNKFWEFVTVYL